MTKLLTCYNHVFSVGKDYINAIWSVAKQDTSINGLYLCLPEYLQEGYLGVASNPNMLTWYNMLADGNYLYGSNLTRVLNSDSFNDKPCIRFNDDGSTRLSYKYPVTVGTLVLVYLVRQAGSYIVFAPRQTPPPNPIYYDAFPSGGNNLWANEPLANGSIYNAQSRINGKDVAPNVFVPLNSTRVLSVKDIANLSQTETISGYGGQRGVIGGGENQGAVNSFKGSLAAIITYENNISDELLIELESTLAQYYVQYNGAVQQSFPTFKYLIGSTFSYDFSSVFIDEWFNITNYELISPNSLGLTFSGSVLSGTLNTLYDDKLIIAVTNSANMTKQFSFDLVVCRQDPLVNNLPALTNLSVVLSANGHNDGGLYGLKIDNLNNVLYWEDARRVHNSQTLLRYTQDIANSSQYISNNALFNNQSSVRFGVSSALNGSSVNAKTFVWVYNQTAYGNRQMLNTFPDIKGTGVLWTVSSINETHGSTPVTRLNTKVQRIGINTLNFTLPLDTPYIITATVSDDTAISFSGLQSMRGDLAFFAAWDTVLTNNQLDTVVSLLATRYYSSLAPYVFNTNTEFRTQVDVSVDLTRKVSDLRNQTLSYNLLTSIYDAAVNSSGLLTFTATQDELINFSIDVTNTAGLTSRLEFAVDITLRTNSLYLNLKSVFLQALTQIFIAELDTLTLDGTAVLEWDDYRLNGFNAVGNSIALVILPQLNDYYAADFDFNGQGYFSLSSSVSGRCFGMLYIRKEATTGRAFLFGQTSTADFLSGLNGTLWDDNTNSKILNGQSYVNGKLVDRNYSFTPQVVNTLILNATDNLTINTIAKDRLFSDHSVKGYVPVWFVLNRVLTEQEALLCNKYLRDYYDPPRFITLLHFDTSLADASVENKVISGTAVINTTIKKFGNASLRLVNNSSVGYLEIPNDITYAHLVEDFTITFWVQLSRTLNTDDILSLYNQTDLTIYVKGDILYVGRNTISDLALLSYTLQGGFLNTFNHIALVRYNKVLTLYINGATVASIADSYEYKDYNTLIRVGQRTGITTTNVTVYLDEFAVYKRGALYTTPSFTPPTTPYTI